jgi:hypothetical protein
MRRLRVTGISAQNRAHPKPCPAATLRKPEILGEEFPITLVSSARVQLKGRASNANHTAGMYVISVVAEFMVTSLTIAPYMLAHHTAGMYTDELMNANATLMADVVELTRRGGLPYPMVYVVAALSLQAVLDLEV